MPRTQHEKSLYTHLLNYILCITAALMALQGCTTYQVSLNNQVVYTPPPLFNGYSISDKGLRACVAATIAEKNLTQAEQVTQLICEDREIGSLQGVEIFSNLSTAGFSNNQLTTVDHIDTLEHLKHLNLSSNNIVDVSSLSHLQKLESLNLNGNHALNCNSLTSVKARLPHAQSLKIEAPTHCH